MKYLPVSVFEDNENDSSSGAWESSDVFWLAQGNDLKRNAGVSPLK